MRRIGADVDLDQVDLGHLQPRELPFDARFEGVSAAAAGNGSPQRPEDLVLKAKLVGSRRGNFLSLAIGVVHRVDNFATVVDQRLEYLLERRPIYGVVPPTEADDREHLARRWNGPLNELSALLLKRAKQLRREHQRSAGAGG